MLGLSRREALLGLLEARSLSGWSTADLQSLPETSEQTVETRQKAVATLHWTPAMCSL